MAWNTKDILYHDERGEFLSLEMMAIYLHSEVLLHLYHLAVFHYLFIQRSRDH